MCSRIKIHAFTVISWTLQSGSEQVELCSIVYDTGSQLTLQSQKSDSQKFEVILFLLLVNYAVGSPQNLHFFQLKKIGDYGVEISGLQMAQIHIFNTFSQFLGTGIALKYAIKVRKTFLDIRRSI
jgi:hypothetical protein